MVTVQALFPDNSSLNHAKCYSFYSFKLFEKNEKGMTIGSYLKKDLIRIEANLRVLNGLNQSDDLKEPMRVFLFPNNLGGTGNYPVASWEVKKVTKHFPITQNIWCRIPIRFRFPTATKVSRENE